MTDVKAGGATVFTSLGVKLWPTKVSITFGKTQTGFSPILRKIAMIL